MNLNSLTNLVAVFSSIHSIQQTSDDVCAEFVAQCAIAPSVQLVPPERCVAFPRLALPLTAFLLLVAATHRGWYRVGCEGGAQCRLTMSQGLASVSSEPVFSQQSHSIQRVAIDKRTH